MSSSKEQLNCFSQYVLAGQLQNNFSSHISHQKLKAYINPQIVNCEYIKRSLSFLGNNKIHVNPNFKGNRINKIQGKHNEHPSVVAESNLSYTLSHDDITQNTLSTKYGEKKNVSNIRTVSPAEQRQDDKGTVTKVSPQFRKVNNFKVTNRFSKSKYSWSRDEQKNLNSSTQHVKNNPVIKKDIHNKERINYNFSKTPYKYTSDKILKIVNTAAENSLTNNNCSNLYASTTKIFNKSKTTLVNKVSFNDKSRRMKIASLSKGNTSLSKFRCNKNKKSILKIANSVKNKYKYWKAAKCIKYSKYKIDKRKIMSGSAKQKNCLKNQTNIKKLFPLNFCNKMRFPPNYIISKSSQQNCIVPRSIKLWRKKDENLKKTNHFPNRRLVNIGGIFYKSTLNKLTLAEDKKEASRTCKMIARKNKGKKSHIVYVKGEKFILDKNGKTLRKQEKRIKKDGEFSSTPTRIDIGGVTYLKKSVNTLIRTNVHHARHLVNRAKHKSITTLYKLNKRSSMHCMLYHKFGRCIRHNKGLCMYKHDPKNIAICKKFLKGKCSGKDCLLSHEVIQEKMATCHFYLNEFCTRENCPFLHVKLNKNAGICENFLRGFCNLGKNCSDRHEYICPEIDKYGTCKRGVKCHYPHKVTLKTKSDENLSKSCINSTEDGNLKYYVNSTHSLSRQKQEKVKKPNVKWKENTVKKLDKKTNKSKRNFSEFANYSEELCDAIECVPKKIKLDQLPCFIPLKSEQ